MKFKLILAFALSAITLGCVAQSTEKEKKTGNRPFDETQLQGFTGFNLVSANSLTNTNFMLDGEVQIPVCGSFSAGAEFMYTNDRSGVSSFVTAQNSLSIQPNLDWWLGCGCTPVKPYIGLSVPLSIESTVGKFTGPLGGTTSKFNTLGYGVHTNAGFLKPINERWGVGLEWQLATWDNQGSQDPESGLEREFFSSYGFSLNTGAPSFKVSYNLGSYGEQEDAGTMNPTSESAIFSTNANFNLDFFEDGNTLNGGLNAGVMKAVSDQILVGVNGGFSGFRSAFDIIDILGQEDMSVSTSWQASVGLMTQIFPIETKCDVAPFLGVHIDAGLGSRSTDFGDVTTDDNFRFLAAGLETGVYFGLTENLGLSLSHSLIGLRRDYLKVENSDAWAGNSQIDFGLNKFVGGATLFVGL